MKILVRLFFTIYFAVFFSAILLFFLVPVFEAENISYSVAFINIALTEKFPVSWHYIKYIYCGTCLLSFWILTNSLYSVLCLAFSTFKTNHSKSPVVSYEKKSDLDVNIGRNSQNKLVSIPISGLYQNVLVTGSIGSGKTSSLLYPLTSQLLELSFSGQYETSFLVLDVKGNYHNFVEKICKKNFRISDLFVLSLSGNITYNPLDKPNLKPHILANRLTSILLLFSPEQSEAFWLDKAEQVLTEAIRMCRLYNDGYVTFTEIHQLVMSKSYFDEKLELIKSWFYDGHLASSQVNELSSCISFFNDEFFALDDRTKSILRSEISRITNVFVSDSDVSRVFCPARNDISFPGFEYVLKNHKIVVLNMNLAEYSTLSKIIAAYLKIDFQAEILMQLSKSDIACPSCFICDEYHEYVTKNDASFFAQSREAKSINIVATQSYSSLLSAVRDETNTKVLIQNFINKFWFRTDDSFTIEEILKQTGKEEKEVKSKTISENARQTNYSFLFNNFFSKDSNISESINTSYHKDYIYDSNFFSRELETFSCLAFVSTGKEILPLEKLWLKPYFERM